MQRYAMWWSFFTSKSTSEGQTLAKNFSLKMTSARRGKFC